LETKVRTEQTEAARQREPQKTYVADSIERGSKIQFGVNGRCYINPESSLARKLTRARTQLLLNQPFFGTLCLRLKMVASDVPTMATDGQRIVFNPAFVEELNPAELEAVLAHEVMHCALAHHCRREGRDPELWNQAADYAINPLLISNGFTLPHGALSDSSFEGLSAEEIYARLAHSRASAPSPQTSQQEQGNEASQASAGSHASQPSAMQAHTERDCSQAGSQDRQYPYSARAGGFGEVTDAHDEQGRTASQAERERQAREWSIAADQALHSAEACGHQPNSLRRTLQESRESQQDWRAILRQFVAATAPHDYCWTPPNRRFIASGIYLPAVRREGVGVIVIAIDTSGSIGDEELRRFAGEIESISAEAQPEKIHVLYCDAAVQGSAEFSAGDVIDLKPMGGGGTDFRPVFQWVNEQQLAPACLIYLTDLCCHSYPEIPEYPVLWVTDSRRKAPWGETLRMIPE
jgi:predicted metal-dependent peptidase